MIQAFEFKTELHNSMVKIPAQYQNREGRHIRVIVLAEDETDTKPDTVARKEKIRAFFQNVQLDLRDYHFDREEANAR